MTIIDLGSVLLSRTDSTGDLKVVSSSDKTDSAKLAGLMLLMIDFFPVFGLVFNRLSLLLADFERYIVEGIHVLRSIELQKHSQKKPIQCRKFETKKPTKKPELDMTQINAKEAVRC